MEGQNIYDVISRRTNGDIYIGVVGPVRTGKSTFIKRFMDTLVIPNIDSEYRRERATDELPQSSARRTIMTTEPDRLCRLHRTQRAGVHRKQRPPHGQDAVV